MRSQAREGRGRRGVGVAAREGAFVARWVRRRDPDRVGQDFGGTSGNRSALEEKVEGPDGLGLARETAEGREEKDDRDQTRGEGGASGPTQADPRERKEFEARFAV